MKSIFCNLYKNISIRIIKDFLKYQNEFYYLHKLYVTFVIYSSYTQKIEVFGVWNVRWYKIRTMEELGGITLFTSCNMILIYRKTHSVHIFVLKHENIIFFCCFHNVIL